MAARFWVGGTAAWDATAATKWSTTSGGAGGAAVPTSADDVFFDANSATGAPTVTVAVVAGGVFCNSIDFTGYNATFAGSGQINVFGNWVGSNTTWTFTYTGLLSFSSPAGSQTITSNGTTFNSQFSFNGAAGTWTLLDPLTTLKTITLGKGTWDLNGQYTKASGYTSNSGFARTRIMNGATFEITGSGATAFVPGSGVGATVSAAGSLLKFSGINTNTIIVWAAGQTQGDVEWSGGTAKLTFNGGQTSIRDLLITNPSGSAELNFNTAGVAARNIDFTGFTGTWSGLAASTVTGDVTLSAGMTSTMFGVLNFAGAALQTLTSSGKTLGGFTFNGVSYKINGNLTYNGRLITNSGALDASNITIMGATVSHNGGGATIDFTNSNITLTGLPSGTTSSWIIFPASVTLTGTVITLTNTNATVKSFKSEGYTYPDVRFTGGGGTGYYLIDTSSGGNTFLSLTIAPGQTVKVVEGFTQIFPTETALDAQGTPGNPITFASKTPGMPWAFSSPSGFIRSDYLNITDGIATGGARWFAGKNSVNNGGNNGWRFTDAASRPPAIIRFSRSP